MENIAVVLANGFVIFFIVAYALATLFLPSVLKGNRSQFRRITVFLAFNPLVLLMSYPQLIVHTIAGATITGLIILYAASPLNILAFGLLGYSLVMMAILKGTMIRLFRRELTIALGRNF